MEKSSYQALDLVEEPELSLYGQDDTDEDHTTIFRWIGGGFFQWLPVYGASWAHTVWMCFLLVMLIGQCYFIRLGSDITEQILLDLQMPGHLHIGLHILPVFTLCAVGKMHFARKLLRMKSLAEVISREDSRPKKETVLQKLIRDHGNHAMRGLSKGDASILKKDADLPQRIRLFMMIVAICVALAGSALYFVVRAEEIHPMFFLGTFLPLIIAWLFFLMADTSVYVFSRLWRGRIAVATKCFMRIAARDNTMPEGECLNMLSLYVLLDSELIESSLGLSNIIYVMLTGVLVLAYLCVLIAINSLKFIEVVTMVACCAGLALVLIVMIYPLAMVTDKCSSRSSLEGKNSLVMSAVMCAALPMNPVVTGEYLRLMHVMETCPIGVKLPFIGLIDTTKCAVCAKTVACLTPPVLTLIWNNYMHSIDGD